MALVKHLVTGALTAGLTGMAWLLVVLLSIRAARKRGHRGHWWCLYILGLHSLLSSPYARLGGLGGSKSRLLAGAYQLLTLPFGCELPLAAQLGVRLFLGHTAGVVINELAIIGNDCVITAGVVIGGDGRGGVPRIGNNVYLGANAVIVGAISIADGATVGAGAVIAKSVPAEALVVGNPAQVVKVPYHRTYHNCTEVRS